MSGNETGRPGLDSSHPAVLESSVLLPPPDMRSASGTFHTGPESSTRPATSHSATAPQRRLEPTSRARQSRAGQGCPRPRRSPNSPAHLPSATCHLAAVAPSGSLAPWLMLLTSSLVHSRDWVARYPISLLWSAHPGRILTGRGPLEPPCRRSSVLGLTSPAALAGPGWP